MRTSRLLLSALAAALVLSGCGETASTGAAGSSPSPTVSATTYRDLEEPRIIVNGPDDLVVGRGMLMQKSVDGPVELCVGGVRDSYPPQCGGIPVIGAVDWSTLKNTQANGVRWSNGEVWAVGRLGSAQERLTLDRPLTEAPPKGHRIDAPPAMDFPQLCDNPYAGGGRAGRGSMEDQERLAAALEGLDGYIGSWVSDGSSMFNVLVTGDPVDARARLRQVWKGGLCVEQRDLPTAATMQQAQDTLIRTMAEAAGPVLSTVPDVDSGVLDVGVFVLDRSTHDTVLKALQPWLEPGQVRFSAAFTPYGG